MLGFHALCSSNFLPPQFMSMAPTTRSASWKWWICALLLFASMINYMDRQTLANAAKRITDQFHLREEQYGNMELVFGWAFAVGSMFFGVLVDRVPVRWLYPPESFARRETN